MSEPKGGQVRAGLPDERTVRAAIALAIRAPSVHNSQPWRWRVGAQALHLFADQTRWLPATDPEHRDLLLSCGTALHHARVAFAAMGWASTPHRLADPADPNHLATLEFTRHDPTPEDTALAAAIEHRRTDRRRLSSWPVPPVLLSQLAETAAEQGAVLVAVLDPTARYTLATAINEAARLQNADPLYTAELARWSGRGSEATEGVPAANVPVSHGRRSGAPGTPPGPDTRYGDTTMREFEHGELTQSAEGDDLDASELLVLATSSDDRVSQLRAGEALSAVLLCATGYKLSIGPLSQPLEIGVTREVLRDRVLGGSVSPQIVLRVGWAPVSNPPVPTSPRRSVDEVLDHLPP